MSSTETQDASENSQTSIESGESVSLPNPLQELLACLVIAARLLRIPADPEQLERAFPIARSGAEILTLLKAAKSLGLKAKRVSTSIDRLEHAPVPSLIILKDTSCRVLINHNAVEKKALLYHPSWKQPEITSYEDLVSIWAGEAIFLTQRFSLDALDRKFGFSWFIPVVVRFRKFFGEVLLGSFFLQFLGLAAPMFSQVIIDKVLVHKGVSTLDILVIGMVLINLFEWILGIVRSYLFSHTTHRVDVLLGAKLFRHLVALPLPYFEARTVGTTIARVRELETIRSFLTGTALTVVLDLFFIIVFISVMFYYSAKLTLISLLALPFFIILSFFITPVIRARLQEKFMCNAESQSFLVETVTGIHTAKSLAIEPQLHHKWEERLANYAKSSFKAGVLGNIAGSTAQFIQKTSTMTILWFGAHMVMESELTVGKLIAFQMLSGRVTDPILRLAQLWQDFQQIGISIERLGDVLNFPAEPHSEEGRSHKIALTGNIAFSDVTFRYNLESPPALTDITFEIPAGTVVGIVGRSGSGKSTLTKLIQRFYIPERGRILIDGYDIAQQSPAWLRRQIGVVLQENFLFAGTIRENIATVDPAASMEKILRVSQLAGAHEFIQELPDGYDTQVGERGTTLSGGQRQRIAIARTLLTDPKILIFDEATSALDSQSERIIQSNLAEISKGRTVLMIAHRLSTIRHADIILVLDKGRVAESGKHDELVAQGGIYASLVSQQSMS